MLIKKLQLKNFKNYTSETIEFSNGLNVLYGKNAQGKTNAVEAIFYLCTGTSLKSKRDKLLINNNADNAQVIGECENRFGKITLEARIFDHYRELYINSTKISKSKELLGNVNCVFFSPSELRLIQDGPDERRRFLNISICQNNKNYYSAVVKYNNILDQRNALLKDRNVDMIFDTLPVWDEQFSQVGADIIDARQKYIKKLSEYATINHSFLTKTQESLELSLEKTYNGDKQAIQRQLLSGLQSAYEKDVKLGYTTVGPHRDDIDIKLNNLDAKNFCSQGQTRTIALALKLGEVDYFKELNGEYPVLILDDVLSELDIERKKLLIKKIEGIQTIITCANKERTLSNKKCFKQEIENGQVKR